MTQLKIGTQDEFLNVRHSVYLNGSITKTKVGGFEVSKHPRFSNVHVKYI